MSDTDLLIKNLAKTITEIPGKRPSAYDTQAEVRRVEGNTAWVHIPGGVDETPVQLTTNAKKGDVVQVRVSGGRAWLYGNQTSPPTDDTTAKEAKKTAVVADEHATNAVTSAMLAQEFAEQAKSDAESASIAAGQAWTKAGEAETAAQQAQSDADSAKASAGQARDSATDAYNSANMALTQLGVVEDVVGVLDLLAKNGVYEQTTDLEVVPDKWYFERTGTAPDYKYSIAPSVSFTYFLTSDVSIDPDKTYYARSGSGTTDDPYYYTVVDSPVVADIGTYYENTNQNYYVLTGIDEAIQNYVSSHLVLSGDSLFLQNSNTRLELNTQTGMTLYDQTGAKVAKYGTDAVIGDERFFHIAITPNYNSTGSGRISFYSDPSTEVAYISGNQLYITQSVVLQQMDVGTKVNAGGLGQWSWKVHEISGRNNLYLKWLG